MLSCVGYQKKMSGWNPLVVGPFLSMDVLCGLIEILAESEIARGN
jgi:hypothetical protein